MLVNPCKSSLAAVGFSLFIFFVYPGSLGAGANGHAESSAFNLPQWPVLRMFNARRSLWNELPQDLVEASRPCEVALVLEGRLQE